MISFLSMLVAHPVIPLFLIANLAIGIWAHTKAKKNSFEDYALASRNLPTGVLVMTILGTIIGTGDLAEPGYVFKYGILEGMCFLFLIGSAFLVGTFLAPYLVHFHGTFTMGDLMAKFYGRWAQVFVGLLGCVIASLMIISQIRAIATVTQLLLGVRQSHMMVFLALFVVAYSLLGGMRAVSYTDVFQSIAIFMLFGWTTAMALEATGGVKMMWRSLPEVKKQFFTDPQFVHVLKASLFWGLFPTFVLTPPIMQRMLVAQDKRKVRKVWYLTSFVYLLIWVMIILLGLSAIASKQLFGFDQDSSNLLLRMVKFFCAGKKWLIYSMYIGFLAILFSTIDSYLQAMSVSVVQDLIVPLLARARKNSLRESQKLWVARGGLLFSSIFCFTVAYFKKAELANKEFYEMIVLCSGLTLVPLIIGIVGVKTDRKSLMGFSIVYFTSIGVLKLRQFHLYDCFLISLPLALLAYFTTHIYLNRGIVFVKRSKATVAEQLWVPTREKVFRHIRSWLLMPLRWHILASRKVANLPSHPLAFSMGLFALYTFSSVMTGGSANVGLAGFMAAVHVVGITLCAGLMLEGIWPGRLKPYFALYWFCTLFYCLPFGGTLAFLRAHGGVINAVQWVSSFVFLAILVDSASFLWITLLGGSLAFGGWYVVMGAFPVGLWQDDTSLMALVLLLVLIIGIFLLGRNKEKYARE